MKTLFTAGLLLLSLFACKDREQNTTVLPPATQTGANTGGALVDGKVWVATQKNISSGLYVGGTHAEVNANGIYILGVELQNVSNSKSRIILKAGIQNFEINKEYLIPIDNDINNNLASYTSDGNNYYFAKQPSYTGKLKITRLDIPQNIISGTFEFKGIDNNGNIINITDGRFDKKFD